ncbi:TIGR02757 family protein [Sandaracinus amylolyticus]|uniref:TIGR02757 family protein n=1 Tax=Sandaracinus amylolyticus TaxID=927083 RepID=UPI001F02F5DF|nr:TIGR02757 family protein [Sandaracinus amylolyticus]
MKSADPASERSTDRPSITALDCPTPVRSSPRLELVRERLDALLLSTDAVARRDADPVSFVHRYARAEDREVVALIAASLAFGNVVAIRGKVALVLKALGESPAATIDRESREALETRLHGFVHRVWRGPDVAAMLANAGVIRRDHGSLGAAFATGLRACDAEIEDQDEAFVEALARLADALRGEDASRGLRHLVPDPRAGSACKRLLLWLRWMIRPADGVDLGLWPVSPSRLVIPVDTHVHRIAKNLDLTRRNDASLRTAAEITSKLRTFDANDPVRYDFAICHLGVSRECPSRRDAARCETCVLKEACRHWQRDARKLR